MSNHPEQIAIGIVLANLRTKGREAERRNNKANRSLRPHFQRYASLTDAAFADLHQMKDNDAFPPNQVIFLPPPPKQTGDIAALWYKWHFDATKPISMSTFYYGTWRMVTPHPKPTAAAPAVPAFMGFRFEPPGDRGTRHGYYHSQPCRSMGADRIDDPAAMDISSLDPSWPLPASNAVELLLCMIVALYGFDKFDQIEKELLLDPKGQRNAELRSGLAAISKLQRRK